MMTVICKNSYPVSYANNEFEAKKKIMEKLENHPEFYNNNPEIWWERTTWNVKQVYSFVNVSETL